jgi:hypothetical protein
MAARTTDELELKSATKVRRGHLALAMDAQVAVMDCIPASNRNEQCEFLRFRHRKLIHATNAYDATLATRPLM